MIALLGTARCSNEREATLAAIQKEACEPIMPDAPQMDPHLS